MLIVVNKYNYSIFFYSFDSWSITYTTWCTHVITVTQKSKFIHSYVQSYIVVVLQPLKMGRLCRNLSWPKKVCWLIIFNKVLQQLNASPMGPIMTLSFRSFVGVLSLSYLEPHSLPKQRHLKLLFILLAIQILKTVHRSMCKICLYCFLHNVNPPVDS